MPLFEYTCQSCGHRFEHLVRADREAACPKCHGTSLNKLLSTFAVGASFGSAQGKSFGSAQDSRSDAGPCGACGDPRGPGACSLN